MGNTLSVANIQTSLTRGQKEAVGLLSIGTFLEYFDLMLYIHMAVLLNDLFFPKADPLAKSLVSAFSFCSTYLFRPFGALIFGYLGDTIGRKSTVILTTMIMTVSCFTMAIAPTYADVGITASIIITVCRIMQGLSSMGEKIGAEVYLTETFKPPVQYPVVAHMTTASSTGTMFAILISTIMTSYGFNWRYAFGIGAFIAVIGFIARSTLRESVEFADAKRRLNRMTEGEKNLELKHEEKVNKKTALALFLMQCTNPIFLYITYIFSADILKNNFGFSSEQVIQRNLIISIVELANVFILAQLSYKIHPLKILRVFSFLMFGGIFIFSFLLNSITPTYLLLFQLFIAIFAPTTFPAAAVLVKYFPIFKRFTSASLIYALSRAGMYIITSFGLNYLVEYFDYVGILIVVIPVLIGYYWGLHHFQKLEEGVLAN
jgi:MFS family permease